MNNYANKYSNGGIFFAKCAPKRPMTGANAFLIAPECG